MNLYIAVTCILNFRNFAHIITDYRADNRFVIIKNDNAEMFVK